MNRSLSTMGARFLWRWAALGFIATLSAMPCAATTVATPTPTRSFAEASSLVLPPGCLNYDSTDVPKAIPEQGAVASVLTAPPGMIVDLNVLSLNGTHTYISDLEFHLISPTGTDVKIISHQCGSFDDFALDLDDAAATAIACPMIDALAHQPTNALSAFNGQNAGGTWTLQIVDTTPMDSGQLGGWGLQICGGTPTPTPTPCKLGDANNNGAVALGEVEKAVSNYLGAENPMSFCPYGGPRFVDNGDGTVTDMQTRLMWELKTDDGGVHDKDNRYPWSSSAAYGADGAVFTTFLNTLNGGATGVGNCVSVTGSTESGGFAGHCDWRLPTVAELRGLLLSPQPCNTQPCIDAAFGPTQSDTYWSATALASNLQYAFVVSFYSGAVPAGDKSDPYFARAVRGG